MIEFLQEPFIIRALIATIPIAMLSGIIGSLIVSKQMVYISGSLSHAIFGGIALGLLAEETLSPLAPYMTNLLNLPLLGAFFVAFSSAVLIAFFATVHPHKQDILLSLLWSLGIASGIIFLSKSKSFTTDLTTLLFGDLFLITQFDLILIIILLVITCLFTLLSYRKLQLIFLDEAYARLKDISVPTFNFLILLLIACAIVTLLQAVGITMVIALFSLGSATAMLFTQNLFQTIVVSILLNVFYLVTGIFISILFNIPATPAVILIAGIIYLIGETTQIILSRQKSSGA